MTKIIRILVSHWHIKVWFPFITYLLKTHWGRPIVKIIQLFFGSLVVLRIIAPEVGEIPCLIHILIRSKNPPYKGMKFKKRIKLLLKFWRSIK